MCGSEVWAGDWDGFDGWSMIKLKIEVMSGSFL